MSDLPDAAVIEIIDPAPGGAGGRSLVVPKEIRINGRPVLAPADAPVVVHEIRVSGDVDVVQVTLTLFARLVKIGHQDEMAPLAEHPA